MRHSDTKLKNWTDGNIIEMIIDSDKVMKHFHDCLFKMICFVEKKPNLPPPQIWIANFHISNVDLLGPGKGGKAFHLMLKAARAGVLVYLLHSADFGMFWKKKQKHFIKTLNEEKNGFAALDSRYPPWAVHHQKFYVCFWPRHEDWMAVVSSAGFNEIDWDNSNHADVKEPTHEFSVLVQGPAVLDLAYTFAERWNDRTNIENTYPNITASIPINFLDEYSSVNHKCTKSVQVLRTYPIHIKKTNKLNSTSKCLDYSWSDIGEFTVWGSYLQAIKNAKLYIYLEDQFFNSFLCPPVIKAPEELLRKIDLVHQLGKALERNVDVIVLVPEINGNSLLYRWLVEHQKLLSLHYLYDFHANARLNSQGAGRLVIRTLSVNNKSVMVHSKLMIVDDEFVLVGNSNIGPRSMTFDSEVHLGIVDQDEKLARDIRLEIWKEHLQLTEEECDQEIPKSMINRLKNPKEGIAIFSNIDGPGGRRLRPFVPNPEKLNKISQFEKYLMRTFAQPYAGPDVTELWQHK